MWAYYGLFCNSMDICDQTSSRSLTWNTKYALRPEQIKFATSHSDLLSVWSKHNRSMSPADEAKHGVLRGYQYAESEQQQRVVDRREDCANAVSTASPQQQMSVQFRFSEAANERLY